MLTKVVFIFCPCWETTSNNLTKMYYFTNRCSTSPKLQYLNITLNISLSFLNVWSSIQIECFPPVSSFEALVVYSLFQTLYVLPEIEPECKFHVWDYIDQFLLSFQWNWAICMPSSTPHQTFPNGRPAGIFTTFSPNSFARGSQTTNGSSPISTRIMR